MNSEKTTQEDVLVKTDPFYLKVTEGVEGVYLYDIYNRVIYIELDSKHFGRLLKGKFESQVRGTSMEGVTVGQKYVITFETDQDDQLVMKYRYTDKDILETFVSEVRVLSEVSKDRTYLTTTTGDILKPLMGRGTLNVVMGDCEDKESYLCQFSYKNKNHSYFKTLTTTIVKNNSIIRITDYHGKVIAYVHSDDLIQPHKKKQKEEPETKPCPSTDFPEGTVRQVSEDMFVLSTNGPFFNLYTDLYFSGDIVKEIRRHKGKDGTLLFRESPFRFPSGRTHKLYDLTVNVRESGDHFGILTDHTKGNVSGGFWLALDLQEQQDKVEPSDELINLPKIEDVRKKTDKSLQITISKITSLIIKASEVGDSSVLVPKEEFPESSNRRLLDEIGKEGYRVYLTATGDLVVGW